MPTENKYLTTKNILWTFGLFVLVIFLRPSAGVYDKNMEFLNTFSHMIEAILLSIMWSFSSIIEKKRRKLLIMTLSACLCYSLILFAHYWKIKFFLAILFINPVSMSLAAGFIYDKKYRIALFGYFIGVLFSFSPLMGSITCITFFQLFLSDYPIKHQTKSQSFFSRLIAWYFIAMGFAHLGASSKDLTLAYIDKGVNNFYIMILLSVIFILIGYLLLHQLLMNYYRSQNWKYVLSYIPSLWIIPWICIPFEDRENKNDNRYNHENFIENELNKALPLFEEQEESKDFTKQ